MSLSNSPALQSKRQQFRSDIRKKQLDDYRRRKREEYFGYISSGKKNPINQSHRFMQKVSQQFRQRINQSPYAFRMEFKEFFLMEFEQALQESRWSLEIMNEVLKKLVVMNIGDLANFDIHNERVLFSIVRMLTKMLNEVCRIPRNSILRTEKHELVETIYEKVFYSLKNILKGIMAEQDHQQHILQTHQKLLLMEEKLKNKQLNQSARINAQSLKQNLTKLTQNRTNPKHPLECCIKQISDLLEMFFGIYMGAEDLARNCQGSVYLNQQTLKYLDYYSILWYMMSFMRSGLFTSQLFTFFHGQLSTLNEMRTQMVEFLVQTLSNFLLNESDFDQSKKKSDNHFIKYDPKQIHASLGLFESFLINFDISSSTLITIIQTMTHGVIIRKSLCKFILNSSIFSSLITIVKKSQEKLIELARQHVKNKIAHGDFEEEAQKIHLQWKQKFQIYQFLGALFSSISLNDQQGIQKVETQGKDLLSIIYFEFNKIMVNEIEDKALRYVIELQSAEERQKVTLSVLFLLFNLFSFSPKIIENFIQKKLFAYILGIWEYFSQLQDYLLHQPNEINNQGKLKDIKKIKYAIISAVWNIVAQFWFPDKESIQSQVNQNQFKDRSEGLVIMVEFKHCGLVKMLLQYLKAVSYQANSFDIDKDAVKYTLLSLYRFQKFIMFSSMESYLCESLQKSSTQVNTVKQVLSRIMESDHIFDKDTTTNALKCLQLFDIITSNANYNEDQGVFDRGYYEQPTMDQENFYGQQKQENQNNNYDQNWNNHQQNQQNWNYNQQNQGNWNNAPQNQQNWNYNTEQDVEI